MQISFTWNSSFQDYLYCLKKCILIKHNWAFENKAEMTMEVHRSFER